MAKRSAKHVQPKTEPRRLVVRIFAGAVLLLLISGPSLLHFLWGVSVSPVLSASMVPYVEPGDVLVGIPTPASDLKVGDIIVLRNVQSQVSYAHRIIEIRNLSSKLRMTTKGDANPTPETAPLIVTPGAKVQKEILRIKWLGAPLTFLNSDQGRLSSISLVALSGLGFIFLSFQKRSRS